MTLDQFSRAIVESGLLSADEVGEVRSQLPAETSVETLARALLAQGKLTRYHVSLLLQGRAKGLVLGDYRILEKLGSGGMGQVYKAEHRRMRRIVALKVMSPGALKSDETLRRFEREVVAAARLAHPNIVTAFDSSEAGGLHYLVTEFVDGPDLAALIKKRGPLTVGQTIHCVLQAARGLAYAHDEGVVHRDIKPANLLVDSTKTVKILDMGLARLEGVDDQLTNTEQVIGTVDYMSPEQAEGSKQCGPASDQYSLGCTLWYLLTGRRLYEGDSAIERFMRHREAPIPSLSQGRDDVPWALDQTFKRMVAKLPADRYPNMHAVVVALEAIKASSSGLSRLNRREAEAAPGESLVGMQAAGAQPAAAATVARPQTDADTETQAQADTQSKSKRRARRPAKAIRRFSGWARFRASRLSRKSLAAGAVGVLVVLLAAGFLLGPGKRDQPEAIAEAKTSAKPPPVADARGSPKLATNAKSAPPAKLVSKPAPTKTVATKPPPAPILPKDRLKVPGPDAGIMLGLVARPAQLPGLRRWQVDTVAPRGTIQSLSFSPDGNYFALAARGSGVRIFATRKRRLLGVVPLTQVHFTAVRVAWHPSRPLVAVAGNGLTVVNVNTGTRANLVEAAAWVRSLAWSPDGHKLAAGMNSPLLRTWVLREETQGQSRLDAGPELFTAAAVLPQIAWKSDSKTIVFLSGSYPADAWQWALDEKEPKKLPRPTKGWRQIVSHPVEPQLVGVDDQKHDALYDLNGAKVLDAQKFSGSAVVRDAAWSPDGQRLVVGTKARVIRVLKPDGELINEATIAASAAGAPNPMVLIWSADSQVFLAGGEFGTVGCFSSLGIPLWTLANNGERSLAIAAAAKPNLVASVGDEARVRIWSPAGQVVKVLSGARSTDVAWSPDGLHLATSWDSAAEPLIWLWTDPMKAATAKKLSTAFHVDCLAWSPDGSRLAVAADDQTIRLLDAAGVEKTKISGLPGLAGGLAWDSAGKRLAASFPDARSIGIWAATGKLLNTLHNLPASPLALAWQPKGNQLACADRDGGVACYESTGKELWRRARATTGGKSLAWSPDGSQLAFPGSGSAAVRIFSAVGQPPVECLGLNDARQVSWTTDGKIIAACEDSIFRCWDAKTAGPLWTAVALSDGYSVGFGPGGMPQYFSPEKLAGQFVFILERDDDRIELVDYAAFSRLAGLSAK